MNKKYKTALIVNIIFAALIIAADIIFINFHSPKYVKYITKSLASGLFVLMGLINLIYVFKAKLAEKKWFTIMLFIGLVFAMLGDILLIDFFIIGAILFAIGHVFFFVSFILLYGFKLRDLIFSLAISTVAVLLITLYKNFDFDGMKAIVVVYAIIISFMLGKALSNLTYKRDMKVAIVLFVGALLFFLSDLMLLFDVFMVNAPYVFDLLCLVFYYPAEILLAFGIVFTAIYYDAKNHVEEQK